MKILLIDDHPLVREGVRHVLARLDDRMELTMATTGADGLRLARAIAGLDLVLLDLALPDMKGLDALVALRPSLPAVPVVVLSASEDRVWIQEALRRGAAGYIPKSLGAQAMLDALRTVLNGAVYLPEETQESAETEKSAGLTPRQRDVLQLLTDGRSNKEIAQVLGMSEGTVRIHVSAVLKALGVANRTEAALAAVRVGILGK